MRYEVETLTSLEDVRASEWDALVPENNPFLEHAYLHGLERSGSVGTVQTGWVPHHLLVYDNDSSSRLLVGAAPIYLKYDSYGEFIFDWAWADGARRAGIPYYPKLVNAVPYTPVMGDRLLSHPDSPRATIVQVIADAALELMTQVQAWSTHILFCTEQEKETLGQDGWLPRTTQQFHWQRDPEWKTFEDFLASLKSRKRYKIRRERRLARELGLELTIKKGGELTETDWKALWRFYRTGCQKKHSIPYLTPTFFEHLKEKMADRVLAPLAYRDGAPMAGALFFHKGDSVFARYWGCDEELEFLHFELCYYAPIEWCIKHGYNRFEGGAQGEQKLARGLNPTPMHSAHIFRIPQMNDAVSGFLQREVQDVRYYMRVMNERGPFKKP